MGPPKLVVPEPVGTRLAGWEKNFRAREYTAQEWQEHFETFKQLYFIEDHCLSQVRETMAKEYNFYATEVQCKRKIKEWKLEKNTTKNDALLILKRREKRNLEEGKETEFYFKGRPISEEKLERLQMRYKGTVLAPSPVTEQMRSTVHVSTPSCIEYWTPRHDPGTLIPSGSQRDGHGDTPQLMEGNTEHILEVPVERRLKNRAEEVKEMVSMSTPLAAPIPEEHKSPLIMPLTTPISGGTKPSVGGTPWTKELLVGACSELRFEPYFLNWFDRVGVWVEQKLGTPIDWWPLNPPIHLKGFDLVRMSWKCTCGAFLSSVVSIELAERYQRFCAHPPEGTVSGTASTAPGSNASQPDQPSTRPSAVLAMSGHLPSQQSATAAPSTNQFVQLSVNLRTFILCCIKKRQHRTVLAQVAKTPAMNDREFFWDLRREYYRIRGWRYWVGLSTVERIKFVRFTRYYLDYVDCHEPEELPPHTDRDYEYVPKPPDNPPMLPVDEFLHYFYQPNCAGTATDCLDLIPKRVVGKLESGKRVEAWGLQPREGLSFWRFLSLLIFVWLGTFTFVAWWLVRHPSDLQNAFVPANYATSFAATCVVLPEIFKVYT